MSLQTESDKIFWHHYNNCYDQEFSTFDKEANLKILEIGVFRGHSIKMLLEKFPNAEIYGVDILKVQDSWPNSPSVNYFQIDTSSRDSIRDFMRNKSFDIIIDDGSHIPSHQSFCLYEGITKLAKGGLYILEDIHTSMPEHLLYQAELKNKFSIFQKKKEKYMGTALTSLLAFKHIIDNKLELTEEILEKIAKNNFLTLMELAMVFSNIKTLYLFKRTDLPSYCYRCNSNVFDYNLLQCECGVNLFSFVDSMTFIIRK